MKREASFNYKTRLRAVLEEGLQWCKDVFDDWDTPGFAQQLLTSAKGQIAHIGVMFGEPKHTAKEHSLPTKFPTTEWQTHTVQVL